MNEAGILSIFLQLSYTEINVQFRNYYLEASIVAHTCNPSTWKAEAEG
jgi:hypothetical protein